MVFKTAEVGKAAVLGFRKKRSMMELQNLQEALKVEIQIHQKLVTQMKQDPQNADLKLQLRDLQAKITALSERQKKVVEQLRRDLLVKQEDMKLQTLQADGQTSTLLITQTPLSAANLNTQPNSVAPVIASKTLPLVLRAATPSSPIIMTPAPTITVVTTLGNTLLASPPNSDPQSSPVNFQPVIQAANQGAEQIRVIPNNTVVVQAASQPIKVPQFVPPIRQTSRPATLPQVRPKPPASLSPAVGQVSLQTLQSPVLLSTALPSSGHVQQMHILNGLACPNSLDHNTSILISPSTHTLPSTQTQQLEGDILSPVNTIPVVEYGTEPKAPLLISPDTPTHTSPPPPSSPPAPTSILEPSSKQQENPLKLAFMLSLGLVTRDSLEEIQSRRQERKRRTTANPIYSGATFEPERKKSSVSYLSSINQCNRKIVLWSGGPSPQPPAVITSPDLQRPTPGSPLSPALSLTLPSHSPSPSPSSAGDILQKEDAIEWPGSLAIVHSYISYKAAKEGEKDRLKNWSTELRQERETLEHRVGQLNNSITKCIDSKTSVLAQQREMEASLEKIRGLLHLIRGIQLSPLLYPEPICHGGLANGDTPFNGGSKASSSDAVTDTNNNSNNATDSTEASAFANTTDGDGSNAKSNASSEGAQEVNSMSRIRSEPTSADFSNNCNQGVPATNGTVSLGEEDVMKHKNTNSDLSIIPQALLGPIVPLTEMTEGVK